MTVTPGSLFEYSAKEITSSAVALVHTWMYKGLSKFATCPHHKMTYKYIEGQPFKNSKITWLRKF